MKFIILAALAGQAWAFDTIRWGAPTNAVGMKEPVAAAMHAGDVYVLDGKTSALVRFRAGQPEALGKAGMLDGPMGLAAGKDALFVADTGSNRIVRLDYDGHELGSWGGKGSEPGRLKDPEAVALGSAGRVYVADTGNARVQVFTEQGLFLWGFGKAGKEPGQLKNPAKIQIDLSENIYVLDTSRVRLLKFDPSGNFQTEWRVEGDDFVIDDYGFIYVVDAGSGKINELTPQGTIAGKFGSAGKGVGQLKKPRGIAIDEKGGLLVLDTGNSRLQSVELTNEAKVSRLQGHLAPKISLFDPKVSWKLKASAIGKVAGELFAYLPEEGKFAIIAENGAERKRFGSRDKKDPSATKDAGGIDGSAATGLWVSDSAGNKIQRFTLEGAWQANFGAKEGFFDSKKNEGRVNRPLGIAVNEKGTVYVADTGNRRVDAFSPEGGFLFAIGPTLGGYELSEPTALAWDKEGFLWFSDKSLKKIFKVGPSGGLVASFGVEGDGPGQFQSPAGIAFDGRDYVYVLDAELKRVSAFTKDGKWMSDFFAPGEGERQLQDPVAIAVWDTRLIVSDKGKGQLAAYDLRALPAPPVSISTGIKDGLLQLSWTPSTEKWVAQYKVYRSTMMSGPFETAGVTKKAVFNDKTAVAYETYYYRVAAESHSGDVGPQGPFVEAFVPGAFNKAPVEISSVAIGNLFSANYKWYLKNPAGVAVITNNVSQEFENLKVSFKLKDFMDFGYDTEIKSLPPQKSVNVPLIATLNNKILDVNEDTPVQAEFSLTYFESGKPQTLTITKPLKIYSRNAITWDNPSRIANFLTPKDTPILEFARESLRDAPSSPLADALNANVANAVRLWGALSEHGVQFFTDPSNPYEATREDPNFPVDYTQFPRETLKRKSGQCDDLAVLLVSMLESANIPAAILDFPGHMALMFDTEASDVAEAGLPEEQLIKHNGTYWVPLEPTLVGKTFVDSWRKAAYAYKAEDEKGKVKILEARKVWQDFEPATLPNSDFSAQPAPSAARQKAFAADAQSLAKERYEFLKDQYEAKLKSEPGDVETQLELGLLEYQIGKEGASAAQFKKILAADPGNSAALNNLGNVSFFSGDFAGAQAQYLKATEADPTDPDLWLNLAKSDVKLGKKPLAAEHGKKAVELDGSLGPALEAILGK
jgi:DNA-binding beta-propeller fold protein YncE